MRVASRGASDIPRMNFTRLSRLSRACRAYKPKEIYTTSEIAFDWDCGRVAGHDVNSDPVPHSRPSRVFRLCHCQRTAVSVRARVCGARRVSAAAACAVHARRAARAGVEGDGARRRPRRLSLLNKVSIAKRGRHLVRGT